MKKIKSRGLNNKRDNFSLECFGCGEDYEIDAYGKFYRCKKCGNLLEVRLKKPIFPSKSEALRQGVWKYLELLPIWDESKIVSLSEGGTSLVYCANLAKFLGLKSLFVKYEGLNPTGSFKDRGMTLGVSKAAELGFRKVICASTGNTSASLAAYSARAGLQCTVLVPKGKIALGKIAQAVAYGAQIFQVEGNFDDLLRMATEICESNTEVLLLNSINPFRIEGQKTVSFEITEQLGGSMPEYVVLPVGNGGNIAAAWKGFKELSAADRRRNIKLPKMIGIQADGASPIAKAFKIGRRDSIDAVEDPHTEASAINIGSPANFQKALAALHDSKGHADSVSDEEIFRAQKLLASKEGLFVEPASAAPVAYLSRLLEGSTTEMLREMKDKTVVCIATGNGLKDPNVLLKDLNEVRIKSIPADAKSLERIMIPA